MAENFVQGVDECGLMMMVESSERRKPSSG